MKPRAVVFSPYCLLRPTTNRIWDMRFCDSVAMAERDTTVYYPYVYMKDNIRRNDIPEKYGLRKKIRIRQLTLPLREHSVPILAFIWLIIGFSLATIREAFRTFSDKRNVVFYTRDHKLIIPILFIRKIFGLKRKWKVVFMIAEVRKNKLFNRALKTSDAFFTGEMMKADLLRRAPIAEAKIYITKPAAPEYPNDVSKEEARRVIGYDDKFPLVVYTGKLGIDVAEVRYIIDTARLMPDVRFLFTGGRESALKGVRDYCGSEMNNIILTGFLKEATAIRNYQIAADVLVSYYSAKDHLVEYNYPQKINEYITTGNPIVTPDFPATRTVITNENAFFVEPDNPEALASTLRYIFSNPELARAKALKAKETARGLTFDVITLDFIRFTEKLFSKK